MSNPCGSLKKKDASRACVFLHSVFREQRPPRSRESSRLRWFWSFSGRESDRGSRRGAAIVVGLGQPDSPAGFNQRPKMGQIESSTAPSCASLQPGGLFLVAIHHLLSRSTMRYDQIPHHLLYKTDRRLAAIEFLHHLL